MRDLALAFDAMQGLDPLDPHQPPRPVLATADGLDQLPAGLKVAFAGGYFRRDEFALANRAVDAVAAALGAGPTVEIPEAHRARAAAFLITNAESAAFHLKRLQTRAGTSIRRRATASWPGPWCPRPGT